MPVLVLQPPTLPPLQTYIALSFLSLAWCFLYARDTLETVETAGLTDGPPPLPGAAATADGSEAGQGGQGVWQGGAGANESHRSRYLFGIQEDDYEVVKLCRIMMADLWSVLSLINLVFCILILSGRLVQHIVFGELRASERQHLRDRLWKFIFYKFIIIFGVLNVQNLEEMVMWMSWFAALAFLYTLSGLCKDRFEYLSFSPSPMSWAHGKVLGLLVTVVGLCKALVFLSCYMGALHDWNVCLFTVSEVVLLELRTIHVLIRYGIHFYDLRHEGVWERRGTIMYYTDFIVELSALCIDFVHHFHMLLWGNVFLSMASLVICMELRYLYNELHRRIKRHRNYRQVVHNMQANFPLATDSELAENNDDCAICWEEMKSARKLPCNHLFHNACLRSWLEHETSCPTCRHTLDIRSADRRNRAPAPAAAGLAPGLEAEAAGGPAQPIRAPRGRGHFFHFDGSRIASWIPSFSVEVSHRHLLQHGTAVHTSQLNNMANQVQQMFPNYPLAVLIEDLRVSHSVEVTIDNILEGRLPPPPESVSTDDANPQGPDMGQEQASTPSSSPSPEVASDTAESPEGSRLYDPPAAAAAATTISDSVRQLGLTAMTAQGARQAGRDSPSQQLEGGGGGDVYGGGDTRHDSDSTSRADQEEETTRLPEGPQALPARFSKCSSERQISLKQRKELLLQQARRRFHVRQAHASAANTSCSSSSTSGPASQVTERLLSANRNPSSRGEAEANDDDEDDNEEEHARGQRRMAAYEAAMRRISLQQ